MKKIIFVVFVIVCFTHSYAQTARLDVIANSGEFFSNPNHSLSWTLGECVTETFTAIGNTLTQGFQQSLYVVTSIDELTIEGNTVSVYPNPVSDLINISVKTGNSILKPYKIELFDSQGKILYLNQFNSDLIQLDMSKYSGGFYS